jgi:hypothetical protein
VTSAAGAATISDYSVFGLRVRSELPLPELLDAEGSFEPQVTVTIGKAPEAPAAGAPPHLTGGGLLLEIADVARYFVKDGSSIVVEPQPGVAEANVRLYLLGSAMGALLHQRGLLPLHANAIELGGRAFAFMGASGSGKSTLAAWFHDHGYRIIADDVCAVRFDEAAGPVVVPGLPRLRLWKEALKSSGRTPSHFSRSYAGDETWDKFDVPLPRESAVRGEVELAGVYLLGTSDKLDISRLRGLEAAEAVFANTYRGSYVPAVGNVELHWELCVQLVTKTPVFSLLRTWDLTRISGEIGQLVEHATGLLKGVDAGIKNC